MKSQTGPKRVLGAERWKKERKEEHDKPVTMTNAGKRERGVDGIFTGLLHFFHSGG